MSILPVFQPTDTTLEAEFVSATFNRILVYERGAKFFVLLLIPSRKDFQTPQDWRVENSLTPGELGRRGFKELRRQAVISESLRALPFGYFARDL
ncbi:hypothetical protein HYV31_04105 [candidate division WWE3 bacterium]|nr:hypothetical protein [candidate division WWE3 bacterium]